MLSRRAFAAAAGLSVVSAYERPKLQLVLGEAPEPLLASGVQFLRAYATCPDSRMSPLLTGMYPHAYAATPPLTKQFTEVTDANDETISIYTRLAGDSSGSSSESSVHVPLFIRYPKRLHRGAQSDVLISSVDVMPTVFGLAGLAPPEGIQGRDLSPLLTTGNVPQPASIYAEGRLSRPDEWRMIVRGFDKMVTNARLDVLHLFNLADDPTEADDLALEPGHRLRVDELRALMLDWRKRTADGVDRSGLKQRR